MLDVTYYSEPSQSSGHQESCAYFGVLIALLWGWKSDHQNGGSRSVGWRATQTCLVRKLGVSPFFVQWTGELIIISLCMYVAYLDSMVKQLISSLLPCHCINSCACPIFDSKVILEVYRQSMSSIQTWFFQFHVSRQRLLVVVHTIYLKPFMWTSLYF
jgi:hypothetical protein